MPLARPAPWRPSRPSLPGALQYAVALVTVASAACARHEPPTPDTSPSMAFPDWQLPGLSDAVAVDTTTSSATTSGSASASLPQTRDLPPPAGAAFEARVAQLWEAIVGDEPDRATAFFFPLSAYEQVKDIANPAADWKHRLLAAYARDIHALHAHLVGSDGAQLVALDVPEERARWVEPGEEFNKIGYYRVFGSKLRYHAAGTTQTFDVKSLISWRGEWFVVHLSTIK